ncbi:ABC-type molybdate transport system substrate-binding protein [Azospirillum sp. OGB3]|nr:ABC-type molybdate transport system substrate-binding protein [Azospirillum sp. OGB3]
MRLKALALAVGLLALQTAAQTIAAAAQDLHAYVGAGLRPPVDALIEEFRKETGITVTAEYGGSGQLLARFAETRTGDLFIPGTTF